MRRAIEAATRDQTRRDDSPPMQDISRARSETPFCVIVCVCGHTTSGVWDVELRSTVIEQQPAAAAPAAAGPGKISADRCRFEFQAFDLERARRGRRFLNFRNALRRKGWLHARSL